MKKILVVDDQESILGIFRGMASILKAEVVTETSGLKALGLLKTQSFDLFFIDVMMPEISGIELASRIFEKIAHPKIVLMSGAAVPGDIPRDLRTITQFLTKPFNLKQIEDFLKNV